MDTIFGLLTLAMLVIVGVVGFAFSRGFVSRRLRFVDAIQSPVASVAAGIFAFAVAWPFTLLPFISLWPALIFAFGTAFGTASGVRAIRRGDSVNRPLLR